MYLFFFSYNHLRQAENNVFDDLVFRFFSTDEEILIWPKTKNSIHGIFSIDCA